MRLKLSFKSEQHPPIRHIWTLHFNFVPVEPSTLSVNPRPSLGIPRAEHHASAYAPIPPPRLLQRLLRGCPSVVNDDRSVVGHDTPVVEPGFHRDGRHVEFVGGAEIGTSWEGISRER